MVLRPFGCLKCKICYKSVGWDNRPTAEDTEGQSSVCEHWHTFLLGRDNAPSNSAVLDNVVRVLLTACNCYVGQAFGFS